VLPGRSGCSSWSHARSAWRIQVPWCARACIQSIVPMRRQATGVYLRSTRLILWPPENKARSSGAGRDVSPKGPLAHLGHEQASRTVVSIPWLVDASARMTLGQVRAARSLPVLRPCGRSSSGNVLAWRSASAVVCAVPCVQMSRQPLCQEQWVAAELVCVIPHVAGHIQVTLRAAQAFENPASAQPSGAHTGYLVLMRQVLMSRTHA
jgi:hypothetical protein